MDGFTGFKTATTGELPDAVAVMDPFHVVRLAGTPWTAAAAGSNRTCTVTAGAPVNCSTGPGGPYAPATDLITDKQRTRLAALFATDEHVQVQATWGIYQRMVAAYRQPDHALGHAQMQAVIDSLSGGVPKVLTELITLGRTMKQRAPDVLAYFERPGTSNGPTEALNGRLEHLRGTALGFRNLTNYVARSLLETGGFRPALHPRL